MRTKYFYLVIFWCASMFCRCPSAEGGVVLKDTPEKWLALVERAKNVAIYVTTEKDIALTFGLSDKIEPNPLPKDTLQYVYMGGEKLPIGCPPAFRFKFDNKQRVIEVSFGFVIGPPPQ